MIDSGVRGKFWGTAAGNAPGDPFVCLAWDYFVSNGLQDEIIGKHYMVTDHVELNNSGSIYSTKCIADPKDFNGEERVIIPTGPIRIYNEPEPSNAVPGDAVYTGQPNQTTINDVIHWLNTNVANVFNNTMSYSEINQEYRNQNPQIEWDTTYGGVSPIVVGQSAKTCCSC